jgi:hypothetical protein
VLPDVTSAFLPDLSGPSPNYHDSLASQSPRLMRGKGVTVISELVNCGFSRSLAQCIDRNKVVFGADSLRGDKFQITWLGNSKYNQNGEATTETNTEEAQKIWG